MQNSNGKVFVLKSVFNKNARLDFRPARKFPCIKNTSEFTVLLQEDLIQAPFLVQLQLYQNAGAP